MSMRIAIDQIKINRLEAEYLGIAYFLIKTLRVFDLLRTLLIAYFHQMKARAYFSRFY
jgi:hypothetical protein